MRESEMYNGEYYSNDAMARVEDMRLRYPRRAYNRSLQFADYMKDAAADWPESVATSMWFGCVLRWLGHPCGGEEETFRDAAEEIARLREERK